MVNLSILNYVSFEKKILFSELFDNTIRKYLDGKIEFKNFDDMESMSSIIFDNIGNNFDVTLCYYDNINVMYALSVDEDNETLHKKIIIIKRQICDNDDYGFSRDMNLYKNITCDDIICIIKKKSIIECVSIDPDGSITNNNMLYLNKNDDVGKIVLNNNDNKEYVYLNMSNITIKYQDDENEKNRILQEKANAYNINYLYVQVDVGFAVLNCFYNPYAEKKNDKLSTLVNFDIYGTAIIYFEERSETDSGTTINLNTDFFNKIYSKLISNTKLKRENNHFLNLYRQFA